MLADVAQEGDVFQRIEPFGIVEHDRVRRAVPEGQEAFEDPLDGGDIGLDPVLGEQLARLVLEAGVADLAGAAAHQHDGLVPSLLQSAQQHDLHQAADVERRRGRIEADIARHDLLRRERIQRGRIGELVEIAARRERVQQIGLVGHAARLASRTPRVTLSH